MENTINLSLELFSRMIRHCYPMTEDVFLEGMTKFNCLESEYSRYFISNYLEKQSYSVDFYRKIFLLSKSQTPKDNWHYSVWNIQYPKQVLEERESDLDYQTAYSQKELPLDMALRFLTFENSNIFICRQGNKLTEQFIKDNIDVLCLTSLLCSLSVDTRKIPIDVLLNNYKKQKVSYASLSNHPELPIDFIAKCPDKFSWINLSEHHDLSDEFLSAFGDRIIWEKVGNSCPYFSRHPNRTQQKITKKIAEENIDKMKPNNAFSQYFYCFPKDFECFVERHIDKFDEVSKQVMIEFLKENAFSTDFLKRNQKLFFKHRLKQEWMNALNRSKNKKRR